MLSLFTVNDVKMITHTFEVHIVNHIHMYTYWCNTVTGLIIFDKEA